MSHKSKFGKYESTNTPEVGDCVVMDSDVSSHVYSAFPTNIIEKIEPNPSKYGPSHVVHLARPHLRAGKNLPGLSSTGIFVERYTVGIDTLVKSFSVYLRGPSGAIDNRRT